MAGRCDGVWFSSCVHAEIAGSSPRFNRITEYTLWTVKNAGHASVIRLGVLRELIDGAGSLRDNKELPESCRSPRTGIAAQRKSA